MWIGSEGCDDLIRGDGRGKGDSFLDILSFEDLRCLLLQQLVTLLTEAQNGSTFLNKTDNMTQDFVRDFSCSLVLSEGIRVGEGVVDFLLFFGHFGRLDLDGKDRAEGLGIE